MQKGLLPFVPLKHCRSFDLITNAVYLSNNEPMEVGIQIIGKRRLSKHWIIGDYCFHSIYIQRMQIGAFQHFHNEIGDPPELLLSSCVTLYHAVFKSHYGFHVLFMHKTANPHFYRPR